MRDSAQTALIAGLVGSFVGGVIGAATVVITSKTPRPCYLKEDEVARITRGLAPAPEAAPVAAAAPAPAPAPAPAIEVDPARLIPNADPSWRVDSATARRHTDRGGFTLRVDLTMTRLRDTPTAVELQSKTTCLVGDTPMVEIVGLPPPPGPILIGERGVGRFIDPFYWQPLDAEPTRCDLHFLVGGAEAGRFCLTIGDPEITVEAKACPVDVEAPLP